MLQARQALMSWLHARRHGGVFRLALPASDHGQARAQNLILEALTWLGLDYDEGPWSAGRDGQRRRDLAARLLKQGYAYRCYCAAERLEALHAEQRSRGEPERYDGHCRGASAAGDPGVPHRVRLALREQEPVTLDDPIQGRVSLKARDLDEPVLLEADGTPSHAFDVAVQDMDARITHVFADLRDLPVSAAQSRLIALLGRIPPVYVHLPELLGDHGRPLAGIHIPPVLDFRDRGYLPEVLLTYLGGRDRAGNQGRLLNLDALLAELGPEQMDAEPSVWDSSVLDAMNARRIASSDPEHLARYLAWHLGRLGVDCEAGPALADVVCMQRERAQTLEQMARDSLFLFREPEGYEGQAAHRHLGPASLALLLRAREALAAVADWTAPQLHETVTDAAEELGLDFDGLAPALGVAVSGAGVCRHLEIALELLGRERSLARIDAALGWVRAHSASA